MNNTNGRGVDVVLNSLTGELFDASVRCLASGGRFLEIGKAVFVNRTLLDSYMFLKGCGFYGCCNENIFERGQGHIAHKLVQHGW